MLLEVLLRGSDKLNGSKLVPTGRVSLGDGTVALQYPYPRFSNLEMMSPTSPRYPEH